MPELPEVEVTCRGIRPHVVGHTIQRIIIRQKQLRWPIPSAALKKHLLNQPVQAVSRRAKYILIQMQQGQLVIHLGMSGSLCIRDPEIAHRKHEHFECILSSGKSLRFHDPRRFGAILWAPNESLLPQLAHLGIEPFDRHFNGHYLHQLAQKHRTVIKTFIMDPKIVVGVGNIYASESLFMAGIHPLRKVNEISLLQFNQLATAIRKVLKRAIQKGGTTLKDFARHDGNPGHFSPELTVYDRKNEPCLNCDSLIQWVRIGQRSSYYCPSCQL